MNNKWAHSSRKYMLKFLSDKLFRHQQRLFHSQGHFVNAQSESGFSLQLPWHATSQLIWQIYLLKQQMSNVCMHATRCYNQVSLKLHCPCSLQAVSDHSCKIHLSILTTVTPYTLWLVLLKGLQLPQVGLGFDSVIVTAQPKCGTLTMMTWTLTGL